MKVLTFSTLYPNALQPAHGIFVETRLRHLHATGLVDSRVIAPVAWFPFSGERWGKHAVLSQVPRVETRHGIEVRHPRYLVLPKVGMTVAPLLLARSVRNEIATLISTGFDFDVLDAHYYYPDGVAAVMLGRWFGKPVTITARGTDVNLIPQYTLPRRSILWAARHAAASITVCQALKDELVKLGAEAEKITVLRNGVDLELFGPQPREELRKQFGWTSRVLLSVGHLIERKGHHLIIDAMTSMPNDVVLKIVGTGELRQSLLQRVERLGLQGRVELLGARNQQQLAQLYNAADALVLASDREGMANVLLEALACGTPVVANAAWGTPEVLRHPAAGVLVWDRSAAALAAGCRELFDRYPERVATRAYAESFGWQATTTGQLELFAALRRQHVAVHATSQSGTHSQ